MDLPRSRQERHRGPAARAALPIAVLCGLAAAAFTLTAGTGSVGAMILVFLAELPLFLAGLWLGYRAAILASLAAVMLLLATSPWGEALLFAVASAGPVVFLVRQTLLAKRNKEGNREWYPLGLLTAWLTGFGLLALALSIFAFGGPNGIETALRRALGPLLAPVPGLSAGERAGIVNAVAAVTPGTLAASWMVMTLTNAVLAQGVLGRFGATLRPSPDIATLALPLWLPALFVAAAGMTVLGANGRFLGVNGMIVLAVPLCLAGLGVMHDFARTLSRPAMPLTVFYVFAGLLWLALPLRRAVGAPRPSSGPAPAPQSLPFPER